MLPSFAGSKHLKYFLVQQQQQNQTIKKTSSTSQRVKIDKIESQIAPADEAGPDE